MKKQKGKRALLSVMLCFTLMFLTGCSCGGDFVNCFTNCFASIFDFIGCVAGSTCAKCAVSCATCGFCGGFCGSDCGVYDCMTGYTCDTCAEECRSYTVDGADKNLSNNQDGFSFTTTSQGVSSVTKLYSVKFDTGTDNYYKVVGDVSFKFESQTADEDGNRQEVKIDNVRVTCKLSYNTGTREDTVALSTRWLGTIKSENSYSVEPVFYVYSSSTSDFDAGHAASYTLTYTLYGG